VIQVEIPPLRERPDDVIALAERLLVFFGRSCHRMSWVLPMRPFIYSGHYSGRERARVKECYRESRFLCQTDRIGVNHLPENLRTMDRSVSIGDPIPLIKSRKSISGACWPLPGPYRKQRIFSALIKPPCAPSQAIRHLTLAIFNILGVCLAKCKGMSRSFKITCKSKIYIEVRPGIAVAVSFCRINPMLGLRQKLSLGLEGCC